MLLFDASLALTVFIATDIDDLLLLAVFFANSRFSPRAIVCGQFAGIAVLVLVSALAALLAVRISTDWIALLGLVPLLMGIASLWKLRTDDDDDEVARSLAAEQRAETRLHSQWLAVAAVTIANGGDNLGAYIPLFARSPDLIALYGVVFAAMTALWCALAWWLLRHPFARCTVERHGTWLLPFVLIALGLVILADARYLLQ